MIPVEDARRQAEVFGKAAAASPIVQIAAVHRRRGTEWEKAVKRLEAAQGDGLERALLELVGTVEVGMKVYLEGEAEILRIANQGGVPSVMVVQFGTTFWENFVSAQSPVVLLP